jgi:hypothetical protein
MQTQINLKKEFDILYSWAKYAKKVGCWSNWNISIVNSSYQTYVNCLSLKQLWNIMFVYISITRWLVVRGHDRVDVVIIIDNLIPKGPSIVVIFVCGHFFLENAIAVHVFFQQNVVQPFVHWRSDLHR